MNALTDINERTAINSLIAIAAALLFCSPWLFGFAAEGAAAWNAWVASVAILALAVAAICMKQTWHEWANLAIGAWVVLSPWLLGFAGIAGALSLHVATGSAIMLLAAISAWQLHATPRRA